jgi:ferredoxin
VVVIEGTLNPADSDVTEFLEIIAKEKSGVRLACQLKGSAMIELEYLGP